MEPAQRGTQNQAIGKSRGGLTTKIVALVDALGNLARFVLLPGQRHDSVGVEPLLDGVALGALVGDKAFDSDWLLVHQLGSQAQRQRQKPVSGHRLTAALPAGEPAR